MVNFAKFLSVNGLKRKDIASFLGVSGAFITQITSGDRPLPQEKLAMIKANAYGWDISMLFEDSNETDNMLCNSREQLLISYLQQEIKNKDALIRELYQQIGMLEAKLELARKGEIANAVGGSSSADAV